MNMQVVDFWTEAKTLELIDLHKKGLSFAEIAAVIGTTRNACIGKGRRIKLPERKVGLTSEEILARELQRQRDRREREQRRRERRAKMLAGLSVREPLRQIDDLSSVALHISFENLEASHCRWAYGDDPRSFTFCGHEKADGSSYCNGHKMICEAA